MKKEWVVKDGVVGTAHQSREGHLVDFRPGIGPTLYDQGHRACFRPAKGVCAPALDLGGGVEVSRVPSQTPGRETVTYRLYFLDTWFLGEISVLSEEARQKRDEDYARKELYAEALSAIQQEILNRICEMTPEEAWHRARLTHRDIGRLSVGKGDMDAIATRVVASVHPAPVAVHGKVLSELRIKLLAHNEALRIRQAHAIRMKATRTASYGMLDTVDVDVL